jgi:thiol-disulfide isomerase/thioredoxin
MSTARLHRSKRRFQISRLNRTWISLAVLIAMILLLKQSSRWTTLFSGSMAGKLTADQINIECEVWFNVSASPTLESLRGRPVLIEFWATWCGPCLESIPHVNEFQRQYRNAGLAVLGVTGDDPATVTGFVEKYGIEYAVGAGQPLDANPFVETIPYAVLIAPDGRVVWHGHPDGLAGPLERLCGSSRDAAPFELSPGMRTDAAGAAVPIETHEYDMATLQLALDAADRVLEEGRAPNLAHLFACYWRNVDRADAGEIRTMACTTLVDLWLRLDDDESAAAAIRAEILQRLRHHDPYMPVRSALMTCARRFFNADDAQAAEALKAFRAREGHPLIQVYADRALRHMTGDGPVETPSPYRDAQTAHGRAARRTLATVFGVDGEFSEYTDFEEQIEGGATPAFTSADVAKLVAQYETSSGTGVNALLIRGRVIDLLASIARHASAAAEEEARAEAAAALRAMFERYDEPDWAIRAILIAMYSDRAK